MGRANHAVVAAVHPLDNRTVTTGQDERFLLGCHLSIAGGVDRAIDEAERLGTSALQIFTHSPSVWRMKPIEPETARRFRGRRAESPIDSLVVHTMYLLNLATPDDALYQRSVDALLDEVHRAVQLGADAVVTHLGAHKDAGEEAGIERIAAALDHLTASDAWTETDDLRLLLENTAGAGTTMGSTFGQLAAILEDVADAERLGICLDTCHAFAAGYDLGTTRAVAETLDAFDRALGLDRLEMIHLNDSLTSLGSHRDRHAHIGRGEIGEAGIAAVLRHPRIADRPFVLETPKTLDGHPDADRINLAAVRALRAKEEAQ